LTETAFANSCCSVFHSSIVKVLRGMINMPQNWEIVAVHVLKKGQCVTGFAVSLGNT